MLRVISLSRCDQFIHYTTALLLLSETNCLKHSSYDFKLVIVHYSNGVIKCCLQPYRYPLILSKSGYLVVVSLLKSNCLVGLRIGS